MELKKVFYLINVANVVNMSQPGVCIGGGLRALIRIFGGYSHARFGLLNRCLYVPQAGSDKMSPAPISPRGSRRSPI